MNTTELGLATYLTWKEEEKEILKELVSVLSDTKYGLFPINIKIGNNFGNMKKIKLNGLEYNQWIN